MQIFNFSVYHMCRMWELLAIQCLVPGVDLLFPSEVVINSYLPNTCRLVVAGPWHRVLGAWFKLGLKLEMEEQKAVLACTPQLALCPGRETVARGKWRASVDHFLCHDSGKLLLVRSCQTYRCSVSAHNWLTGADLQKAILNLSSCCSYYFCKLMGQILWFKGGLLFF